jgi:hypothetical protein
MITFSKYKESIISNGKRILKVLEFGPKTANESMPFGYDAQPIKEMTAIYADTSNNSESVIIGYINTNQLSNAGEVRLYSVDENNVLKSFLWLKNDGTLELNGNTYTAVRFEPLQSGINAKDNLINIELGKIAAVLNSLAPGSYTVTPISTNITNAKSEDVKIK